MIIGSTTTHVVNYKNCIIVIKSVPCLECTQCGEKYYTDEVAEHLNKVVFRRYRTECPFTSCKERTSISLQFWLWDWK